MSSRRRVVIFVSCGLGVRQEFSAGPRRGFPYLTSAAARKQAKMGQSPLKGGFGNHPATIIDGMRTESIGRTLGVGLRVAGRMASQRLARRAQTSGAAPATDAPAGQSEQARQAAVRATGKTAKGVARGVGG